MEMEGISEIPGIFAKEKRGFLPDTATAITAFWDWVRALYNCVLYSNEFISMNEFVIFLTY